MAYLSLYRKHRPRTFDEVVGQEHVTRTLVNAITEDRLHHAYLFTGQRGTGKTSTARILAAAVNCEQGPTAEPCGECDQCTSIIAGNNVDVIELDMASHGGVDDARELRDRAVFAPAAARRKVYILDEVHMASTAAFNALLKVVEEPPGHVLFAMATTDPQKVLPTIMSRVQRLDLRRVAAPALTAHLRRLGEEEDFALDDEAAAGVVSAGDGSVRDTLSVLEQVLAFASDADARDADGILHVSGEHVTRVLGATPFELTAGVVDAIADADVAGALTRVQELLDGGHDLRRFSFDLARHLRDLLVLAAAPGVEGLVEATAERRERLAAQSQRFGTDSLVRAVELVGEVLVEQRQGPPRLPLELAVARLATPGADGDVLALADRIARLEKALEDGGAPPAPQSRPTPAETRSVSAPDPAPQPAATPTDKADAETDDVGDGADAAVPESDDAGDAVDDDEGSDGEEPEAAAPEEPEEPSPRTRVPRRTPARTTRATTTLLGSRRGPPRWPTAAAHATSRHRSRSGRARPRSNASCPTRPPAAGMTWSASRPRGTPSWRTSASAAAGRRPSTSPPRRCASATACCCCPTPPTSASTPSRASPVR